MIHHLPNKDEGSHRLFEAAKKITDGDPYKTRKLLDEPQATFRGLSLQDLEKTGRLGDALAYLESISSGFVG